MKRAPNHFGQHFWRLPFLFLHFVGLAVAAPNTNVTNDPHAYAYNPLNARDPFKPPIVTDEAVEDQSLPAIQRYSVSQLRLTSILFNSGEGEGEQEPSRILVKDPKNRSHILKEGDKIGRNRGEVRKISRDRVHYVEVYRDLLGNERTVEDVMVPSASKEKERP